MQEKHDEKSLIDFEKTWDHALHSDQLAAQIGLFALKMVLSVNGAALIAIMAAYPSLAKDDPALANALPEVGIFMVYGLITALLSAMCAYFYQGQVTEQRWSEHNAKHGSGGVSQSTNTWRSTIITTLNVFYIFSWIASAALFVLGCFKLVYAL